ncbi:hypothetical protein [Streptomyces sp. NPDC046862]|uniref:hypothetical protein n=1 Tax=Streptomyces sp. NPDC046862 TaxID=3154603 RepID=UPI003456C9D6
MAQHSIDEVHSQITEIKKKLEAGGGVASQEYIDGKLKNSKAEENKEPSQLENWAKSIGFGLDEVVKSVQDFKIGSLAAFSALGATITGFVLSNVFDRDALSKTALSKIGLERDESGIPRRKTRVTGGQAVPEAPITSVDVDRVKNMRSAAIALSRSLNDLTKDVNNAARQIA